MKRPAGDRPEARAGNGLGFGVLGDVLVGCGEEVWDEWRHEKNEAQRRAELETIARMAARDARAEVLAVVREVAANQPRAVRRQVEQYLSQVHERIRRSLQSRDDPAGLRLEQSTDLTSVLAPPAEGGELRFHGHDGPVLTAAFHLGGRVVTSGGQDGTLRWWDAESGRERASPRKAGGPVTALAVSPDGRFLICGDEDGAVERWDAARARLLCGWRGQRTRVQGVAFSPDGRLVATAGGRYDLEGRPVDCGLRLWDAAKGGEVKCLAGQHGPVCCAAFLPDGRRLLTGEWDHRLRLWDTAGGGELRSYGGHGGPVWSAAVFVDGRHALASGADRMVHVWEVASGRELRRLEGHTDWVLHIAPSPDGRRVASASRDGTIRVWDWRRGRELHCDRGHRGEVRVVAWRPDGRRLLSGGNDGVLRQWTLGGERPV